MVNPALSGMNWAKHFAEDTIVRHLTCIALLAATIVTNGIGRAAETKAVAFDTHDGYFVSNKFEPEAAASFVVIQDRKAFDKVFGSAFVMNDTRHRLPKDAFDKNMVLAAIKRGKALWTFKVRAVTAEDSVLTLRYTATSEARPNTEFACPLIVSVPRGDWSAVQFVEDEKSVKKIDLKGADAATRPADTQGARKNQQPQTRTTETKSL
jgi:hypothetical protein